MIRLRILARRLGYQVQPDDVVLWARRAGVWTLEVDGKPHQFIDPDLPDPPASSSESQTEVRGISSLLSSAALRLVDEAIERDAALGLPGRRFRSEFP